MRYMHVTWKWQSRGM